MGGSSKKTAKGRLDKYYHLAKDQGYRARSAFKLLHLNKKYAFLESAKVVLDLCAAPGGWLQVAAKFMPKPSILVGVDLVPIKPIPGVITVVGDITTEKCRADIKREIKDWKVDVVLHDGAPNVGKAWIQDAYTQSELVLASFKLACELLTPGGVFVTKVFRSKEYNSLLFVFNQLFESVEATKPASSRNVSAEIFVVCRKFKSFSTIDPKFFDPKYVFADEENHLANMQASFKAGLSGKITRTRFRDGYEDGSMILFKEKPLSEFLASNDPVAFLADANRIVIDKDNESSLSASKSEKFDQIAEHLEDIKLLGKKELKALLRWRRAFIMEQKAALKASLPVVSQEADDPEDEMEKISREALKQVKLEKKKALLKKAKQRMRMQLQMENANDILPASDDELDAFKNESGSESEDDFEESGNAEGGSLSSSDDSNDELEKELSRQYRDYAEKKEISKRSDAFEIDKLEEDFDDSASTDSETQDIEQKPKALKTATDPSFWFANPVLDKIMSESSAPKPEPSAEKKRSTKKMEESDKIEFVPKTKDEDFDVRAKELFSDPKNYEKALSLINNRKRAKADLIDESFNRYTIADYDGAPEWFKDDEKKHSKPLKPLSKETVAVIKEKMRALDAKPIKKVLEARNRQRKRAERMMENFKKKSEAIFNSEEISEKEKADKVQSLLRKAKRPETKKKLIVAKGSLRGTKGRPKGVRGKYKMVDRRMLKDTRNNKQKQKNRRH